MTGRALPVLVAGALAATGCMGPRPGRPAASAVAPPSAWRAAPALADADIDPTWWRAFGDDTLSWIVDRALADNTDIAAAAARVDKAEANLRLVRGDLLPQLNAVFQGAARLRTYTAFGKAIDVSGYVGEVQASYNVDLFGRIRNEGHAAKAELLSTRASADAVRLAVVAQAVQSYVQLRLLDASLEIAQRALRLRQDELQRRQHQLREGYTDQLTIEQARSQVEDLEQRIPQILIAVAQTENALSVLLGTDPRAIPRGQALGQIALPAIPGTLPARLLGRRPDLFAAEQDIVAADLSLDSARAAFLPDISLSASGTRIDANILPKALNLYSFVGSVLQPIFEGGKLRARADAAAATRDAAAFAYRGKALDAFREVEDALTSVANLADRERAVTAQAASAQTTLGLARHRFGEGRDSYLEVIDAERVLLGARLSVAEVRAARLGAIVKLYGAMGGGWSVASSERPSGMERR